MPNFNGQGPRWGGGPGAGWGMGPCGAGQGFGWGIGRGMSRRGAWGRGFGSQLGYREPTKNEVKEDLEEYGKMLENELAIVKEEKKNL